MDKQEDTIRLGARLTLVLVRMVALLGSLQLAVVLLAVLAALIAVATVLEADHGRAYAQWYVYHSGWFVALLGLLGVNVFCAAASRWPWKRHQIGFVITHGGLLVLLAGSIQTFLHGVEGHVTLAERESSTTMTIPQRSQITAFWANRQEERPYEFTFQPGPVDWREGTRLDVGEVDGVRVRVRRYYNCAEAVEQWAPDESGTGGPLVRFTLDGPPGSTRVEQSLVVQDYGDEMFMGPLRLQLQRAEAGVMLDHFLKPPTDPLGSKGLLLAYHGNRCESIPVENNLEKKVPLADTGIAVEIAEYLPTAKPGAQGRFHSIDAQPPDPMLELRVHLPGSHQPLRQLAFAKSLLLNLDGVESRACPVKFQYHHPAIKPSPGVELLQTKDGKLYGRLVTERGIVPEGEVKVGRPLRLAGNFTFAIVEHLPHVRQRLTFESVDPEPDQKQKPEAAAEIEVSVSGVRQTLWLQRNHPTYGTGSVVTPEGTLRLSFGQAEGPLGFSLTLLDFHRDLNPGGVGNASFSSVVRLVDAHRGVDEERTISMNEPLTYNGLTFYQSGFDDAGQGTKTSTFSVAHDPGRVAKYAGCLMVCLGIVTMFYMRAYFFQKGPRRGRGQPASAQSSRQALDGESADPPGEREEELVAATEDARR